MFVQTYSYQADPAQTEAVSQFVKHVVVPDIQRQHGFQGLQALVDRQSGKGLGISYWATEADARAAATAAANPPQPPAGVSAPPITGIAIDVFELLVDVPVGK
jgi:heme-degrading monooxygenase HmoA